MAHLLPEWPRSIFPDIGLEWDASVDHPVERTQGGDAYVQQLNRFNTSFRTYSVKWRMNDTQYKFFNAWHFHKLHRGTAFFLVDLPGKGGLIKRRARFVDGVFEANLDQTDWVVTAQLEVERGTSNG